MDELRLIIEREKLAGRKVQVSIDLTPIGKREILGVVINVAVLERDLAISRETTGILLPLTRVAGKARRTHRRGQKVVSNGRQQEDTSACARHRRARASSYGVADTGHRHWLQQH